MEWRVSTHPTQSESLKAFSWVMLLVGKKRPELRAVLMYIKIRDAAC